MLVGLLLCLHLCPAFCCPDLHKTRSKCHLVTFSPQSSGLLTQHHSVPTEKGKKKSCFAERRRGAERKMWLKSCQKAIHPVQKLQGKALQTESSAAGPVLRGRHKAIRGCMANPAPWPSQHFWGWGNDSLWGKGCLVSSVQTDEMSEKLQVKSMTQSWDAVQWLAKRCPASCRLETALQLIHSES